MANKIGIPSHTRNPNQVDNNYNEPFPEKSRHKQMPPGAEDTNYTSSSESVGAGHLDHSDRLTTFDGWPDMEPCGSGPGSGEGIDGSGHNLGQRSPWDE